MTQKTDLLSLDKEELTGFFLSIGEPKYRASQLFTQMHKGLLLEEITNLSKATKAKISETAYYSLPKIEKKLVSAIDGTVKYLFSLECDYEVYPGHGPSTSLYFEKENNPYA